MTPAVSVILPVRNGGDRLRRAAGSVLRQTFRSLELIIVDDASTDSTPVLIRKLMRRDRRVRRIRRSRSSGIVGALRSGMAEARGGFIARIDHDDEWTGRAKLARQVAALRRDPRLALIGTGALVVRERTGRRFDRHVPASDRAIRGAMLGSCPFVHSSVVFRKDAARAAGGYTAEYIHAEDYYLWLRIGLRWRMANLPGSMVRYAWRPGGLSAAHRASQWWSRIRLVWRFGGSYPGKWPGLLRNLLDASFDVSLVPVRWLADRVRGPA